MKKLLTLILVIILLGAAIGGFLIYRHASTMIGRDAAVFRKFMISGTIHIYPKISRK